MTRTMEPYFAINISPIIIEHVGLLGATHAMTRLYVYCLCVVPER